MIQYKIEIWKEEKADNQSLFPRKNIQLIFQILVDEKDINIWKVLQEIVGRRWNPIDRE